PQINTSSFVIEIVFQTAPGQSQRVLLQKRADAGYDLELDAKGTVTLSTTSAGDTARLASHGLVNDGKWHHLLAEADRKTATFTIYLDGKRDATGPGLGVDASLANEGDLYVGGTPNGRYFNGAIDFLRIARGTLNDSK